MASSLTIHFYAPSSTERKRVFAFALGIFLYCLDVSFFCFNPPPFLSSFDSECTIKTAMNVNESDRGSFSGQCALFMPWLLAQTASFWLFSSVFVVVDSRRSQWDGSFWAAVKFWCIELKSCGYSWLRMLKFIVCVIKAKMHSLIGKQQKCVHSMCFLHRALGIHRQIKG